MRTRTVYRVQALAVIVALAALAIFAAGAGWRAWQAKRAHELLVKMALGSRQAGDAAVAGWGGRALTTAFADSCWSQARANMLRAGAPAREVDGVLRAARAKSRETHSKAGPPFAVPSVVRQGYAGPTKVWMLRLQWEMPHMAGRQGAQALRHWWVLVLDASPPHRILASERCG